MSAGLVSSLGTIVIYHIDQSCCMYEEVMPSIMLTQRQLSVAAVTYRCGFLISAASVAVKADRRCTLPSLNTREPSGVSANTHSDQRSRDTEDLLGCEGNPRAGLQRDRLSCAPCKEDQDIERHHPAIGAARFVGASQ